MAKRAKKAKPKAPPGKPKLKPAAKTQGETMTPRELTTTPLVAAEAPHSLQVDVTFTFTSGIGQVTATLFRHGVLINMQSISNSGIIKFAEVQTGDVISVNGICAGKTDLVVNTPTVPVTPKQFKPGLIMANLLIIN